MAHKICLSCVSAMSKPYPKSLTYYLVNDMPRGISDMYPTSVRRVFVYPRVRHTDTPQDCCIHASEGKTTVTQLAYNHQEVKAHFDERIWVCFSDPFDPIRVSKAIVEALKKNPCNLHDLEATQ